MPYLIVENLTVEGRVLSRSVSRNGGGYPTARHCAVLLARRQGRILRSVQRLGIEEGPFLLTRLPNGIDYQRGLRRQRVTWVETL